MHPTKLLFAGDCHLTGIRAAIADAFSIHARHCTSLMASLRFCRADYKKKTRALCAHTIRRCSVGSSSDWWITRRVRTVMVSVNRCTRYSASTRRKSSSAILKHQRILRVQDEVDIPTTYNSHDWSLLQTQPFYFCWQFNIAWQKSWLNYSFDIQPNDRLFKHATSAIASPLICDFPPLPTTVFKMGGLPKAGRHYNTPVQLDSNCTGLKSV